MKRLQREILSAALLLAMFSAPIARSLPPRTPAAARGSAHARGFWDDPCTTDGVIIGLGAVTQSWGAVGIGALKAWKTDGCSQSESMSTSRFSTRARTVGVRYRLGSRVWLGGGAGLGSLRYQPDSGSQALRLRQSLALTASTDIEIVRWRFLTLVLQGRVSTAKYGELTVTRGAIQFGYQVWLPLG